MKIIKYILEKISFNNLFFGFVILMYINLDILEFGVVGYLISVGNVRKIFIKIGLIFIIKYFNIEKFYKGSVGCINVKWENIIGSFIENIDFGIRG